MPSTPRVFTSASALLRFFGITALGLAIDLWTKHLAVQNLKYTGNSIRFIPNVLHFDYVENRGAVFGIGQGQRWLFVAVSIGAIAFLTFLFRSSGRQRFYQVLLGLLLAGVLGNMYDRLVYGYVRDFLHSCPGWHWPGSWQVPVLGYPGVGRDVFPWVFNVADSMLCVGVALMVIYSFVHKPEPVESSPEFNATPAPSK